MPTCDANASLISNTSMSSIERPAISTAAGMATAGPMPMTAGGTPTAAKLQAGGRAGGRAGEFRAGWVAWLREGTFSCLARSRERLSSRPCLAWGACASSPALPDSPTAHPPNVYPPPPGLPAEDAQDEEASAVRLRARHQHRRRRAVGDLAAVARGGGAPLLEHRPQLAQRGGGGAGADAVVLVNYNTLLFACRAGREGWWWWCVCGGGGGGGARCCQLWAPGGGGAGLDCSTATARRASAAPTCLGVLERGGHGHDFVAEPAGRLRRGCQAVRARGKLVLEGGREGGRVGPSKIMQAGRTRDAGLGLGACTGGTAGAARLRHQATPCSTPVCTCVSRDTPYCAATFSLVMPARLPQEWTQKRTSSSEQQGGTPEDLGASAAADGLTLPNLGSPDACA